MTAPTLPPEHHLVNAGSPREAAPSPSFVVAGAEPVLPSEQNLAGDGAGGAVPPPVTEEILDLDAAWVADTPAAPSAHGTPGAPAPGAAFSAPHAPVVGAPAAGVPVPDAFAAPTAGPQSVAPFSAPDISSDAFVAGAAQPGTHADGMSGVWDDAPAFLRGAPERSEAPTVNSAFGANTGHSASSTPDMPTAPHAANATGTPGDPAPSSTTSSVPSSDASATPSPDPSSGISGATPGTTSASTAAAPSAAASAQGPPLPPPPQPPTGTLPPSGADAGQGAGKSKDAERPMTLLEHLTELRSRLLRAFIAVFVGFLLCYGVAGKLFSLLAKPLVQVLPADGRLMFTGLAGGFFVELKVAFVAGIFLASPYIFYQIWAFISPGLYEQEKRQMLPLSAFSAFFFLAGAAFCYFAVFPVAFAFFMSYSTDSIVAMPSINEYLSFALQMLVAFGVIFEMPVFAYFLARMGMITAEKMRKVRRYAILGIFVVAAIFTPPDVFSQTLMAVPMLFLYEVSIFVASLVRKNKDKERREAEAAAAATTPATPATPATTTTEDA